MINADRVVSVLLAAGQSRRFGSEDKLLADLDGRPLVLHAAEGIIELNPSRKIAICRTAVGDLLRPLGFDVILNTDTDLAMSGSLALGIGAASRLDCDAALVTLGDMPFVTVHHLQQLLAHWNMPFAPVLGSTRHGIPMPPALFARSKFSLLTQSSGDRGARDLLATADLVEPPPEQLADIDTIGDLVRLRR